MARRVLFAPRNISGQATQYCRAIAPLGYTAEVWSYQAPVFGFHADRVLDEQHLLRDPALRWTILEEAVDRFDVFHFQFGRSLLPVKDELPLLWDLPLLASLGKTTIMHFRGTDVRRRSAHLAREPDSYFRSGAPSTPETHIDGVLAVCREYCSQILVSTPGLIDDVPEATWLPHMVDVDEWLIERGPEPTVPVLAHIPSRRSTKGSDVVDAVGGRLQSEGLVRYRSVSGLGHDALRDLLHEADIVVDSLGIGDHGLLSVEAMAAGAIAVAHVSPLNRQRNPGLPVVEATTETLEAVCRRLISDPEERVATRAASVAFVRANHSLEVGGARLDRIYRAARRPVEFRPARHPDWPARETARENALRNADVMRLERLLRAERPVVGALRGAFRHTERLRAGLIRRAAMVAKRTPVLGSLFQRVMRR